MQEWKGWTASAESPHAKPPTWVEWRNQLQEVVQNEQRHEQHACTLFSGRELARLTFIQWLYQTGRLDP